jgi:NADP-dependent 3-hydroxy acid dehydrogenase YdfG
MLINNAGLAGVAQFQDIEECDWNRVVDANLKSAYLLTRAVLPGMIAQKSGCIVNIASMWGQVGASCEAHYSAREGRTDRHDEALAKEVGPSGIPGQLRCTGRHRNRHDQRPRKRRQGSADKRNAPAAPGLPGGNVAGAVLFLTGPMLRLLRGRCSASTADL